MHIRDPIHGAIEISPGERALIDTRPFQRLRFIRQLGFAEQAFPGATHVRYAHSLGAMHVASRLFDAVFAEAPLNEATRARMRQALRIAVLFHDLGHPPLSHTSEVALPPLAEVGLPPWLVGARGGQATHEDMTLKLVLDSPMAQAISTHAGHGIGPEEVASLISGAVPPGGEPFVAGAVDYTPVLRQLVSSELDADRMDYLFRDSLYTGVNYGKFDLDWIVQNLGHTVIEGEAWLAISGRAVYAFEDFLLSRFHMFMSVYFHRTSIAYEQMLGRFFADRPGEYRLSPEPARYLESDDVELWSALRASDSEWARRVVERRPYKAVYEAASRDRVAAEAVREALSQAGFDVAVGESRGEVSKYLSRPRHIYVRTDAGELPVEGYTHLFERYAEAETVARLYVPAEHRAAAREVVAQALSDA